MIRAVVFAGVLALTSSSASALPALLLGKGGALPKLAEPRVVVVRDGTRTVLTLATGVGPGAKEIAWLVPVPKSVTVDHFNVGEAGWVEALDRYTAPRLVVVRDPSPCAASAARTRAVTVHGLTERAKYGGGGYDVTVLSPKDSAEVPRWLAKNGYKLSPAAMKPLAAAIKAGQSFAFAKITLPSGGAGGLKPLQVAYDDDAGALPLTIGAAAISPPEGLRVYVITSGGKAELAGIKSARFPAGEVVPAGTKDELPRVYDAMTKHLDGFTKEPLARLEYAGDLGFCEPCVADAPSVDVLRKLGVFWLKGVAAPAKDVQRGGKPAVADATGKAFITRWRVAYDAKRLTKDPSIKVGDDRNEFQPRLDAQESFAFAAGDVRCDGAAPYEQAARTRETAATAKLAELTGWDKTQLGRSLQQQGPADGRSWVDEIWK